MAFGKTMKYTLCWLKKNLRYRRSFSCVIRKRCLRRRFFWRLGQFIEITVPVAELPSVDWRRLFTAEFWKTEESSHNPLRILKNARDANKPFFYAKFFCHAQNDIAVIEKTMQQDTIVSKILENFPE